MSFDPERRFAVVFDTNVLLSSTLWDGSVAQKLLQKMILSDVDIFSSSEILEEYQKILRRDFDYTEEKINKIMIVISAFLKIVEPKEKVDAVKDDPDDNKVIECALASGSEYILTYDNHLLKLNEFRGIKIIKPEELLKLF